jgi:hypothetical protein
MVKMSLWDRLCHTITTVKDTIFSSIVDITGFGKVTSVTIDGDKYLSISYYHRFRWYRQLMPYQRIGRIRSAKNSDEEDVTEDLHSHLGYGGRFLTQITPRHMGMERLTVTTFSKQRFVFEMDDTIDDGIFSVKR